MNKEKLNERLQKIEILLQQISQSFNSNISMSEMNLFLIDKEGNKSLSFFEINNYSFFSKDLFEMLLKDYLENLFAALTKEKYEIENYMVIIKAKEKFHVS